MSRGAWRQYAEDLLCLNPVVGLTHSQQFAKFGKSQKSSVFIAAILPSYVVPRFIRGTCRRGSCGAFVGKGESPVMWENRAAFILGTHKQCPSLTEIILPLCEPGLFLKGNPVATIPIVRAQRERGNGKGISHQSGVKWRKWQLPINRRRRRRVTNYTVGAGGRGI